MDHPYPYLPQNLPTERLNIDFSTNDITTYSANLHDLEQTICLWGPQLHLHSNIFSVQTHLALRYGGTPQHYPATLWKNFTFLVRLPYPLNRALVIQDILPWCSACNILVTIWNPNLYLFRQPIFRYQIQIVIINFPLPLWHEFFIIRFLSLLGQTLHVDANNLFGYDKSRIMETICCFNPRALPQLVNVHFHEFWTEVRIHIRFWDDLLDIPPHMRPYPDFADPDNPYGDDYSDADSMSPIRAHAINCHDALKASF